MRLTLGRGPRLRHMPIPPTITVAIDDSAIDKQSPIPLFPKSSEQNRKHTHSPPHRPRDILVEVPKIQFLRSIFSAARPPSPASMSAARTKAQGIIDNAPVAVFSKSWCPYCKASKELLSRLGAKVEVLELDQIGVFSSFVLRLPLFTARVT